MATTQAIRPFPQRKKFREIDLFEDSFEQSEEIPLSRDYLREKARWIRDDLDPNIAREGPSYLNPDQVIVLFKLFNELRRSRVLDQHLGWSRMHLAVQLIASRATRWPGTLIDEAEKLIENWSVRFGPLSEVVIPLYEEGGRLHGICAPSDLDKEVLEIKWHKAQDSRTGTDFARQFGDLGFVPGDWWLNPMFAYHAGIIDSGDPSGRVIADKRGAYAILLNGSDEIQSSDPNTFTYQTRPADSGKYKLTAATTATRKPVRVLRSHTLRSFWSPSAGIRYDGLYKVTGWSIKNTAKGIWTYDITFSRLPDQAPMTQVLRRPIAEEADDYKEYKRIRALMRASRNPFSRSKPLQDLGRGGPSLQKNRDLSVTSMADDMLTSPALQSPLEPLTPRRSPRPDMHIPMPPKPTDEQVKSALVSAASTALSPASPKLTKTKFALSAKAENDYFTIPVAGAKSPTSQRPTTTRLAAHDNPEDGYFAMPVAGAKSPTSPRVTTTKFALPAKTDDGYFSIPVASTKSPTSPRSPAGTRGRPILKSAL